MTIDEAISHALEVALQNEDSAILYKNCKEIKRNTYEVLTAEAAEQKCLSCAAEHRQLAEWLTELKEAKRLLQMAVEEFREINSDILTCKYCRWYSEEIDECTYYPEDTPCEQICGWKHEVEALKLIGEDEDENNGKH
jgi:hypothetical protein